MCMRVRRQKCGKPTWSGCGRHIESALAGVPADERCRCREEAQQTEGASAEPRRKLFGLF